MQKLNYVHKVHVATEGELTLTLFRFYNNPAEAGMPECLKNVLVVSGGPVAQSIYEWEGADYSIPTLLRRFDLNVVHWIACVLNSEFLAEVESKADAPGEFDIEDDRISAEYNDQCDMFPYAGYECSGFEL